MDVGGEMELTPREAVTKEIRDMKYTVVTSTGGWRVPELGTLTVDQVVDRIMEALER